jgi:archaellum component FlaC
LCEKRHARRYCPGVGGDICPICCGTERENSIDCPSECNYLQEARLRERPAPITEDEIPNKDIRVSEDFLEKNENAVVSLTMALTQAMAKEKAVDRDAREALDALIRTYRTLESGLIYETRPQNPYAAAIQEALKQSVEELRKRVAEESGMHTVRDADILGTLVFLQRLELQYANARPRGRAFFDFLRTSFPEPPLVTSLAV